MSQNQEIKKLLAALLAAIQKHEQEQINKENALIVKGLDITVEELLKRDDAQTKLIKLNNAMVDKIDELEKRLREVESDLAEACSDIKKYISANNPLGAKAPLLSTHMTQVSYNGYTNYETWVMATQITNNEALYNKVRECYFNGFKAYGTMLCVLRDFSRTLPKGQLTVDFRNDNVSAKEITKLIECLFSPNKILKKTRQFWVRLDELEERIDQLEENAN